MDEQRLEAYANLIEQLLSCPSGQELEILQVNSNLVDQLLVRMMRQFAKEIRYRGESGAADFLENIAAQLAESLGFELQNRDAENVRVYESFLRELFKAEVECDYQRGNPEQFIYPILQRNLELLDMNLINSIQLWVIRVISAEPESVEQVAAIIENVGLHISGFSLGNRAINLEIAIECYKVNLSIKKREINAIGWAQSQSNLGSALINRLLGDKAQNIEDAIIASSFSLEVFTREFFPVEWARSQLNLGTAFLNRLLGDKAQNIEDAIVTFYLSLEVFTHESFPVEWATLQNNLGSALIDRVLGDKAQNIEDAIVAYAISLIVFTVESFPFEWARSQCNLGVASCRRILGDKAQNIEDAITFLNLSLKVFTIESFPYWWGRSQVNLGNSYRDRVFGDKSQNIEDAITSYTLSLKVFTLETFPFEWSMVQNNLGGTFSEKFQGSHDHNFNQAISFYLNSLKVRTRERLPQDFLVTKFNLGLVYSHLKQWVNARQSFSDAIETADFLRGSIISGDETKRKFNETWINAYVGIVEVCVEMQDYQAAIAYAERSKTRNLIELIATKDLYPYGEIPREIQQRIQDLRQQIYQESRQLEQMPEIERDTTHINHFRQEFQNLFPYQPLTYTEIQPLSNTHTTILEWYLTNDKFMLFILSGGDKGKLTLWQYSKLDLENLRKWADNYLNTYQFKWHWREFLDIHLAVLTRILQLEEIIKQYIPIDCEQLILIPHLFLHLFPLHALPLNDGSYLIDRFPKGIRYAPSCQILQRIQQRQQPTTDSNQRLLAIRNPTEDLDYTNLEVDAISKLFQPSDILKGKAATKDALHQQSPETAQYAHFSCHGYFNFENPLQSALLLAGCKISPLPAEPDPSRYLPTSETSGIDLHKCLTLEDIFRLDLRQCRLVVLSACETGITDFTSTSDEYIGLPSAFLYAGASNVVSSLWSVSDLSTAFLMIRFYEYFQGNTETKDAKNNAAMSMKLAQQWLRDSTKADLRVWSMNRTPYFSTTQNMQIEYLFDHSYKDVPNNQKIFASPFYWAAFQAIGK